MPLPLRMNLCDISIQRLLKTASAAGATTPVTPTTTPTDSRWKENKGRKVYGPVETFRAQVKWVSFERRNRQMTGNLEFYDGHLTYRAPADMDDLLKTGDKVVAIQGNSRGTMRDEDLVVVENRPIAHLSGPLLYRAYVKRNDDNTNSM